MCKHTWNWYNNRRRSIRLPGYDYSASGLYFVTICTYQRQCLFGAVVNGEMRLNDLGRIVAAEWVRSADIRREIECDEWVVMPNHVHGIVRIVADGVDGMAITNATDGSGGNAVDMADGVAIADVTNWFNTVGTTNVTDGADNVTSDNAVDVSDAASPVDVMDGSDGNVTNGSDNVTFKNVMDGSGTVGATGHIRSSSTLRERPYRVIHKPTTAIAIVPPQNPTTPVIRKPITAIASRIRRIIATAPIPMATTIPRYPPEHYRHSWAGSNARPPNKSTSTATPAAPRFGNAIITNASFGMQTNYSAFAGTSATIR